MRLYLDTCIVNDIFVLLQIHGRGRLRPKDVKRPLAKWIPEYVALYYLLDLDDQWGLEFGSSPIMQEELKKMTIASAFTREKKSTILQVYDSLTKKTVFPELLPVP